MIELSASTARHHGSPASVKQVLDKIMGNSIITPKIVKELANGVPLSESDAGKMVFDNSEKKLDELRRQFEQKEEALKHTTNLRIQEMQKRAKAKIQKEAKKLLEGQKMLVKSQTEKSEKFQKVLEDIQGTMTAAEQKHKMEVVQLKCTLEGKHST
jgi:hypothetical protein